MQQQTLARPTPSEYCRHWTLATGTVFLNHGSFGACPKTILEAQARFREQMEAEPVQFLWRRYEERLEPARRELAAFVGAMPKDLAFVTNATTGVNAVLRSLTFREGDEILTTNHNYNACHNALIETARRSGAKLVVAQVPFPLRDESQVTEMILQSVSPHTRLAMIDHVTSDTALIFPIAKIIQELEMRGVDTLVDGAHAPGMLAFDLAKLRPAFYAGNLHKWVCAPKGAAFLWVREDKQSELQPAVISHGNNRTRDGYTAFQDRFDWTGTFDPSAWFCVGEAIRWLGGLLPGGWDEMRKRNHALALEAHSLLCKALQVEPPCPEEMLGSMATIPLPAAFSNTPRQGRIDPEQLRLYDEYGIEVPFNRFGQPEKRWFRVSAHLYNSLPEYEYLAQALQSI